MAKVSLLAYVSLLTHGPRYLTTLLVKYYNGYPDIQSSWRGMGGVTYLYFGNVFVIPLGSKYADLQQKITPDTGCRKSETFHCSNVTTMKSLWLSTARVECNFLSQIGILRVMGYNKNVPKVQVCNPTHTPSRTLSIWVAIVVLY